MSAYREDREESSFGTGKMPVKKTTATGQRSRHFLTVRQGAPLLARFFAFSRWIIASLSGSPYLPTGTAGPILIAFI